MVKKILIIHQGAIGDFILSLPALSTLRLAYLDATMEIWGYPEILGLVEERFYADRIASVDRREIARLYSENGSVDPCLVNQLGDFDLIVVFGQEGQGIFVDNLKRLKQNAVLWIKTFHHSDMHLHIIDYQLLQLESLGFTPWGKTPRLVLSEEDLLYASQEIMKIQGDEDFPLVALHIGSGSKKKNWPARCFAHLTRILISKEGARIILLVGPADEEAIEECNALLPRGGITPLRNLPLRRLAGIIKCCSLYLGNDSGITHLAAAVGIPVLALFGPTDPRVWGPRGREVSIVYHNTECSPCSRERMKSCVNRKCLEEISVGEVYGKIKSLLDQKIRTRNRRRIFSD